MVTYMLKGIENALGKVNAPIANFAAQFSGFLLLIMTAIVLLQVGCRYILNIPLSWTDESSRFLMIYMTYLCLPIVYLRDQNIAMTFVTDKLKHMRVYHVLMMVAHLAAIVLFLIWIYYGWAFYKTGGVMADSLPIPMYTIYIIPPVMLALSTLTALEKLTASLHNFIHFTDDKKLAEAAE